MSISDIAIMIDKYGIEGSFFIFLFFITISLLKSKWIKDFLSKMSDKLIERSMMNKTKSISSFRTITESDISNHDIFNYIDFWMYSKIPTIQFSTEYRTLVFRKYLTIYLKSYKNNILSFVEDKSYKDMDDARLSTTLLNLINTIIYDYEKNSELSGIPKIVIEKMKLKNNETITLTLGLIEGICSSQFYSSKNNLLKVYSVLNIILSILENTISSSKDICDSINGQLRGLTFEGKTEPMD